MKSERGFALIITLLITALLVALVVEFTAEVYVDTSSRHNFIAGQQASMLAESGVNAAIKLLKVSASNGYTSLNDTWAKIPPISDERGELIVSIEDEGGKLNINVAAPPNGDLSDKPAMMAKILLEKKKLNADLLDAIADWTDNDKAPKPGGAETPYYSNLKPPYASKDNYLETFEELALIKGLAGELDKLRNSVTVYPKNAPALRVNINTAKKELIMALKALDDRITDSMLDQLMEYRQNNKFESLNDLGKVPGFAGIYMGMGSHVTVKSDIFRIHSTGSTQDVSRKIEAVVQISNGSILYWREY